MYARNYGGNENMQSFRRGEYSIPANYAGNAFTADEPPELNKTEQSSAVRHRASDEMPEKHEPSGIERETETQYVSAMREFSPNESPSVTCSTDCPHCSRDDGEGKINMCRTENACCDSHKDASRGGILRDLLSRFERGFELDDWLLIGLILLLLHSDKNECDSSRDEIIIILAFLLLSGF